MCSFSHLFGWGVSQKQKDGDDVGCLNDYQDSGVFSICVSRQPSYRLLDNALLIVVNCVIFTCSLI